MKNKNIVYSFLNRFMKNTPIYWYIDERGDDYTGYFDLPGANPSDEDYSYYFRFYRDGKLVFYNGISVEFYGSISGYFPIERDELISILIDWFNDNKHHITFKKKKVDWL